jgi:hypothetical protein
MIDPDRSYESIARADLQRLADIARVDRESFFSRHSRYATLRNHVLAVALCQGAALHFVDGRNGIKDIDVWTFYGACPGLVYPPRRPVASYDFGDPKFGRTQDSPHFVGRRVDCLGRSLAAAPNTDPVSALRTYLSLGHTRSAQELARKAVVLIEPHELLGSVVWPLHARP